MSKDIKEMTPERIKEIQSKTAYPQSVSVQQALLQVWNECEQHQQQKIEELQNQLYISDKAHQRVCAENVELEQKTEELQKEVKEKDEWTQTVVDRFNKSNEENTKLKRHIKELQDELSCS
jgi:chromosome segregation ATPase